jgi:hypothetical protein
VTTNPFGESYTGSSGIFPTNTGIDSGGLTDPFLPKPKKIPMVAIIGGAVGAVIIVIFILVVGWRYRRRRLPKQPLLPAPQTTANVNNNEFDKAELAGTSTYTANNLSKNSSVVSKPSPGMSVVSPVSPLDEKGHPSMAGKLEMEAHNIGAAHGQPHEHELDPEHARYEVPGQSHAHELANIVPRYEVHGSNQHPVEVPGLSANMTAGPYYELGNYR